MAVSQAVVTPTTATPQPTPAAQGQASWRCIRAARWTPDAPGRAGAAEKKVEADAGHRQPGKQGDQKADDEEGSGLLGRCAWRL
jgi:hypothetical protein